MIWVYTYSQSCQLRCAPRLLWQPLYLWAVGRQLLLQPQVALQQHSRARLILPMILAGQQRFSVTQPGVGLCHICKVLNRGKAVSCLNLKLRRSEGTWIQSRGCGLWGNSRRIKKNMRPDWMVKKKPSPDIITVFEKLFPCLPVLWRRRPAVCCGIPSPRRSGGSTASSGCGSTSVWLAGWPDSVWTADPDLDPELPDTEAPGPEAPPPEPDRT